MGTIKEKLNYLNETKNQIKEAIKSKDVEVSDSDNFRSYADKIKSIKDGKLEPLEIKFLIDESKIYHNSGVDNNRALTVITDCDLKGIENASYLFRSNTYLEKVLKLNTQGVRNIRNMFNNCTNLTQVLEFNTSGVTEMTELFRGCKKLKQIPHLDTASATHLGGIFADCPELTEIPQLDTSNNTNMGVMFNKSTNLTTIPLLDASKVKEMYLAFGGCTNLTTIGGLKNLGKAYTQQTEKYSSYTVNLYENTQLTHDSLINVINNLYDLNLTYDVANGGTLYRQCLNIGSENKAKLTEEEIKIATDKGWDVT